MKRHLISRITLMTGLTIVAAMAVMTCAPKTDTQTATDSTKSTSSGGGGSADRGKYLVNGVGCNDCHTPWTMGPQGPAPDMTKMLSGHPSSMKIPAPGRFEMPWMWGGNMTMTAFSGPWGVSFAANLTPDSLTGIGAWTQDVFVSAIRTGKHMGKGRQILPPMPWNWFKNLNDDDLASMYVYLKTIPPISNQVPDPVMNPNGPMGGMAPPPPGTAPPPPSGFGVPPPPPPPSGAPPAHSKKK
jgi:hypothetical protein